MLTIALALAWVALTGALDPANVVFGLAAGALLARLVPPAEQGRWTLRRAVASVSLAGYFAWELVLANLRVAAAVLGPRARLAPAVVAVPLDARTDIEITLFANLITLTPGTLSVDVSADRRVLYVHMLSFNGNLEATRRALKDGFERRVLEALR
jgi:multicomponent Na+:H+ antiporter subunit E